VILWTACEGFGLQSMPALLVSPLLVVPLEFPYFYYFQAAEATLRVAEAWSGEGLHHRA